MYKTLFLFSFISISAVSVFAQRQPDQVFNPAIKTITLTKFGDPVAYPIINLNSTDLLELNFDDMAGGVKNYFYTYVLCNADWTPALLSYFDYVKGYTQVRISTYRNASIALNT